MADSRLEKIGNLKSKIGIVWVIRNWSFEFVWNLGFEIWNLR